MANHLVKDGIKRGLAQDYSSRACERSWSAFYLIQAQGIIDCAPTTIGMIGVLSLQYADIESHENILEDTRHANVDEFGVE